jgi:hypothetical protein
MRKSDKAILIIVFTAAFTLLAVCTYELGVMFYLVAQGAVL